MNMQIYVLLSNFQKAFVNLLSIILNYFIEICLLVNYRDNAIKI